MRPYWKSHSTRAFAQAVLNDGTQTLSESLNPNDSRGSILTLGLPFYGRDLRTGDWTSYEDLIQRNPSMDTSIQTVAGEERDVVNNVGFNSRSTIAAKTMRLIEAGNAWQGVMIWEVGNQLNNILLTLDLSLLSSSSYFYVSTSTIPQRA